MSDRITVGNVEILAFVDIGPAPRDPAMVFPDVPADAWGAYKDTMTPDGLLPFQMGFFALRSGGQTMLVDTGLGRGPHEAMGGIGGKLMDQISGEGIDAEDISRVLITHLHGDHVGWNITWDGDTARATFPNATYSVPQGDWDHFMSAEVLVNSPHMEANVIPLQAMNAMQLVGDNEAITDEITTFVTPGHTPRPPELPDQFRRRAGHHHRRRVPYGGAVDGDLMERGIRCEQAIGRRNAVIPRATHRGRRFDRRVRSHARRLKHRPRHPP